MIALLIGFLILVSILINNVLNMNLDRFLHQQSDNFQATISIENGMVSFHDLNSGFEHQGSEDDEIPFYLQMLDIHGRTVMLSGNLEGRRLYHGEKLPNEEIYETVYFFDRASRRLSTPIRLEGLHLGWLIVTVPFDYLNEFRNYKDKVLFIASIIGIVLFTLMSIVFFKLALKPVQELAKSAEKLADQSKIKTLPVMGTHDEFGYLNQTLNRLLHKAGQSMETLELFAANVSHELKTPLALMHTEISLLQKRDDSLNQLSYDSLAQEVDRMQTLIENLLVISNSQQPYHVSLSKLWVLDFVSDEAGRIQRIFRHNNMNFDFSKVESIKIETDIYLLQLVVDNLLRNAILYSPDGSTISISTTSDKASISIHVTDTGPGIPEADLSKILEPFVRGKSTDQLAMKGSGLGLSISQWAVNLLGGKLEFVNNSPKGLIASVVLPKQSN